MMTVVATMSIDQMGYAVAWSPFQHQRFAVAMSQNFGIIGAGQLAVIDFVNGQFAKAAAFATNDSVFDCCWSESNASHIVTAHGGGAVSLWDVLSRSSPRQFKEHSAEVYAVDWNLISKDVFASGAWDKLVKVGLLRLFPIWDAA